MPPPGRAIVEAQLERPLRSEVDVVARCHLGMPVVVRVPPFLDDGTPFPTLYWLTCPLAVRRIGRLESVGGVAAMERRAAQDPEFGAGLDEAHARYAAERDALVPEGSDPRPTGGVGGARAGVKCLHAHYADLVGGHPNPVGDVTAPWVEPLDCIVPCVVETEAGAMRNPEWREPS
jgi:hypothetical protein